MIESKVIGLRKVDTNMNEIKQYRDIALPALDDSQKGSIMQATNIVSAYSGEEFEQFILEWLKYCKKKLTEDTTLSRVGGTGDDGIDIFENTKGEISYYQCKRYNTSLTLSQFTDIIIKVLWHSFTSKIARPNNLYIIAFKGVNGKVAPLLGVDKEQDLKQHLIEDAKNALKRLRIQEDSIGFAQYLNEINDYRFIHKIALDDIIKEYCMSPYVLFRFISSSPSRIQRQYIPKEDYEEKAFYKQIKSIATHNKKRVLLSAKEQYYSALCLEETDKYLYGNNDEFSKLEKEVSSNISTVINKHFDDMFERYNAIIDRAMTATANNVSLDYSLHIVCADDKAGICHKFVNEDKLSWEKEDDDE